MRENEGIFEALSGASSLMRCHGMSRVTEKADKSVIVGGRVDVVVERPPGGFCMLRSVVSHLF